MAHLVYSEEALKTLEAALLNTGNKLANPPSSNDELLSLLAIAEHILSHAPQLCPCHKVMMRSVRDATTPIIHALISEKIFKHNFLDIQVAVAACINEIVRITISDLPFTDAYMKDIFGLFMVALKQLSCGSGQNFKRALVILEAMAELGTGQLILDLEFPMDAMVIEMFQLFLNTIRPHHSADMYNHMKKIMILIVQEGDDLDHKTKSNLCLTLLSSVKMDSKNTSPRSWELGKSVIENCALKLQQLVREAVSERNLNLADYSEIVASLCQDAPAGNEMVPKEEAAHDDQVAIERVANVQSANEVANEEAANVQVANEEAANVQVANEEVANVLVANEEAANVLVANEEVANLQVTTEEVACVQVANEEVACAQVANEEGKTVLEEVKSVQFVATEASGDGVAKFEQCSQVGQEMQIQTKRRRRKIKPNTLMKPEEGYKHARFGGGTGSLREHSGNVKRVSIGKRDPSKKKASMMNQDSAREVSDKQKKRTIANHSASDSEIKDYEITAREHESEDVVDKEVESSMSKPTNSKRCKAEKKVSNKGKKTSDGIIRCGTVGAGNAKVSKDNENMSKFTKAKQSKAKEKGLNKRKKATKNVVVQPDTLDAQKEKEAVASPISRKAECPGDLISEKEKETMDSGLEYGQELINLRIKVWWPLDQTYYTGTVESYDLVTKKHKIKYDDDDEEMLDMSEERWELFIERQPRQVAQSSGEQEADPAPSTEPAKTPTKTTKRKAGSSENKPAAAGASSKRSKSVGVHSGGSEAMSIPVNDDSDDETNFSWKARAMKPWSNASSRKGKSSPDDA